MLFTSADVVHMFHVRDFMPVIHSKAAYELFGTVNHSVMELIMHPETLFAAL